MKKLGILSIIMLTIFLQAADRPNILWITAEDMSPVLGCYGDKDAITPNLDALSTRSVRYTHAFATAPVCSPSRSCIINGLPATSQGTQQMRSAFPIPDYMLGFPSILKEKGYFTSNNVKTEEPVFVGAACVLTDNVAADSEADECVVSSRARVVAPVSRADEHTDYAARRPLFSRGLGRGRRREVSDTDTDRDAWRPRCVLRSAPSVAFTHPALMVAEWQQCRRPRSNWVPHNCRHVKKGQPPCA